MGCCIIGVCCPPDQQARALAESLGIPEEAALKVVTAYRLIPRNMDRGTDNATTAAHLESGKMRLAKLHQHADAELRAVLVDFGHSLADET